MKLEINGQVVEVDDSFEKLSDAEKEATVNEIAASLRPAPSSQTAPDTVNPMYGIGGGAAAANLLGRPINKFFEGADKVAPPAGGQGLRAAPQGVPPEIAAKGPDAVENWTKTQHAGEFYGGKDYAGAHQRAMNVKSTLAETPGYRAMQGTGLIAPREAVEGYEASQAAAARRAMPVTQRLIQSSPAVGRTAAGASNILRSGVPPFIGRTTAGGVGGYLGVDAYNRALEGDVPGALISGAGATGAGLSMVPRPKVRGLGILGAGAALGANALRDQKAPPPKKSVMEGYAKGSEVKKAVQGGLGMIGKSPKTSVMDEMLQTKTAPMLRPSGEGPLLPKVDKPYIAEYSDVLPQKRLTRGTNPRMERLQNDPRAYDAIENAIRHGEKINPNLANWYGTNRLLTGMLNEGSTQQDFERLMKHMASASQRNPVPQQNKMGSLLNYYDVTGRLGSPGSGLQLPKGYGSLAQGDIVKRAQQIGAGEYPFDDAIKLGKFYKSYLGYHPENAVVDVIGTRVPTMATRDPEWLVNRLKIGNPKEGYEIISPRGMYERGEITMEEALKRPGFWEAAPSKVGEYAGIEDMWKQAAKRSGYKSGEGQALGWYGSAGLDDVAGLKSKPMTWEESLEQNARERARQTGQHPLDVMSDFLKLKGHLKKGGLV